MNKTKRMRPEFTTTIGNWSYICCDCIVNIPTTGGVTVSHECDVCGNTNLRFMHTLEHLDDGRQIRVGVECARILMEDDEVPTLAENETKRKERWRRHYGTPGRCSTDLEDLAARGKL